MKAKQDIRMKYLPGTRVFLEARRPPADGAVYALFTAHDLQMYLGADIGTTKWCLMTCNREALVTRGRKPKGPRSEFDTTTRVQYAVPAHGKTIRDIPIGQVDYMR